MKAVSHLRARLLASKDAALIALARNLTDDQLSKLRSVMRKNKTRDEVVANLKAFVND